MVHEAPGSWAEAVKLTGYALPVDVASGSCPEVSLWDVTTPSGVFQSKVVVHRLAEFLLAAEISVQWSEPRRAQAETESVQVLRPPNGITVHRCGASHGEQGF